MSDLCPRCGHSRAPGSPHHFLCCADSYRPWCEGCVTPERVEAMREARAATSRQERSA